MTMRTVARKRWLGRLSLVPLFSFAALAACGDDGSAAPPTGAPGGAAGASGAAVGGKAGAGKAGAAGGEAAGRGGTSGAAGAGAGAGGGQGGAGAAGASGAGAGGLAGGGASAGSDAGGGGSGGGSTAGSAGAGAGGLTPGPAPANCDEARGTVGCCGPNNTIYWYEPPAPSTLHTRVCPPGTYCSWVDVPVAQQQSPSFDCLAKPAADPSGAIPYACGPGALLVGACAETASLSCKDPLCVPANVGSNAVCTVWGTCAECNERADCPADKVCGDFTRCVVPECTSDADCGAVRPACDPTIGRCRRCQTDAHCDNEPFARHCSKTGNECMCANDAECAGSKNGNRCVYGTCQCEYGADCGGDRPICPGSKGVPSHCEACTQNWQCSTNAGKPFCVHDVQGDAGSRCGACRIDADCDAPGKPLCTADFECVAGCRNAFDCTAAQPTCALDETGVPQCWTATCPGDDALAGTDDHPATTSRKLAAGVSQQGAVCPQTGDLDWLEVVVPTNAKLTVSVTSADAGMVVVVANEAGREEGLAFYGSPRIVQLTYLPAGKHFVGVGTRSDGSVALPYTVSVELAISPPCAGRSDCAANPDTQYLRGVCDGASGSCRFADAAGTVSTSGPCDDDNDCASGICSYTPFAGDQDTRARCTQSCVGATPEGPLPLDINCLEDQLCDGQRVPLFPCTSACTTDGQCPVRYDTTPTTGAWARWSCEQGRCYPLARASPRASRLDRAHPSPTGRADGRTGRRYAT
jgi:hypothetical protein